MAGRRSEATVYRFGKVKAKYVPSYTDPSDDTNVLTNRPRRDYIAMTDHVTQNEIRAMNFKLAGGKVPRHVVAQTGFNKPA